jgi:hypothetical protein
MNEKNNIQGVPQCFALVEIALVLAKKHSYQIPE